MKGPHLKKGQKVFIQAGSGGVGTFAIQLAKHIGATVATTTSTANVALVKSLGADVVIDYKTQDFESLLRDYDVVLNSQDKSTLEKSLNVLKPGGKLISISGPPDPDFAKEQGSSWMLRQVFRVLSYGIRKKAKRRGASYSFLFMRADGAQLREIGSLIDSGVIRPVIDRVFPFASTNEALAYVEAAAPRASRRQSEMIGPRQLGTNNALATITPDRKRGEPGTFGRLVQDYSGVPTICAWRHQRGGRISW